MKNFFISYNHHDEKWAEWIDWTLREAGYDTIVQVYDFPVGSNFVSNMHDALKRADHVLCVLTQHFLNSTWCEEEYTNALDKLIPVRIADVLPDGILKHRIYFDLFGLSENEASEKLVTAIKGKVRPTTKPVFPTDTESKSKSKPAFPGVLGKEYPDTATLYNNTANFWFEQGDYGKALEWLQKALPIVKKVHGKEHPDTANTYNNIAAVYAVQRDYVGALEWFKKALAIREEVLGKGHPDTKMVRDNIAAVRERKANAGGGAE